MDRLIHTALSGMRASMDSQRVIASNMANANTLGFRAEMLDQRAVTIEGQPNEARAMQTASVRGANMVAGEVVDTGRDLADRGMDRLHGRTAEPVHGLARHGMRQAREQRRVAADVEALFLGLLYATPDHVLDVFRVDRRIAFQQRLHQGRGQLFGTGVTEHAALGAAHRGAYRVNDNDVFHVNALHDVLKGSVRRSPYCP